MSKFAALVTYVEKLFGIVVTDVKTVLAPGLQFIEANGGAAILKLAEAVLAEFTAGESWSLIIAAFIPAAESAGVILAEDAASAILNAAKLNALAGAPAAVVVAPIAPVGDPVVALPVGDVPHPAIAEAAAAGIVGSPAALIANYEAANKA